MALHMALHMAFLMALHGLFLTCTLAAVDAVDTLYSSGIPASATNTYARAPQPSAPAAPEDGAAPLSAGRGFPLVFFDARRKVRLSGHHSTSDVYGDVTGGSVLVLEGDNFAPLQSGLACVFDTPNSASARLDAFGPSRCSWYLCLRQLVSTLRPIHVTLPRIPNALLSHHEARLIEPQPHRASRQRDSQPECDRRHVHLAHTPLVPVARVHEAARGVTRLYQHHIQLVHVRSRPKRACPSLLPPLVRPRHLTAIGDTWQV